MASTQLGLYDDFQQTQRAVRDLRQAGMSLTDIAIIGKRDDQDTYTQYRQHFDAPEKPHYLHDKKRRANNWITPSVVGFALGTITMGLIAAITDTVLFGSAATTLAFMLAFGIVTGIVLSLLFAAMSYFTRVRTTQEDEYEQAMLDGLSILAVRDSDAVETQKVQEIMSTHKPIEITTADTTINTNWLQELDDVDGPSEGVRNNIAGQRHRAYNWSEG